ncbi:hypothetical protein LshimejAT787_1901060 [Lyophyllum shimeji]|uniref:Uncharacterized protein n=1 Tax=Lyophyllum shimeji TaxID=47721 RepID=A0A9P3PZV1_LYOSH|nr:hypothetical protein LshimejAT787_1901060 [Lyophyllum shimeji]
MAPAPSSLSPLKPHAGLAHNGVIFPAPCSRRRSLAPQAFPIHFTHTSTGLNTSTSRVTLTAESILAQRTIRMSYW